MILDRPIPVRQRWLTALEIVFFLLWSGAYVWVVLPLNRPDLILLNGAALFGLTVGSHLLRGTPLEEIGLGYRNFPRTVRLLAIPTLIGVGGAIPMGLLLDTVEFDELGEDWLSGLVSYPFWGLFQQYVFQGYIFVRVAEAAGQRKWVAIVASALLYTLVHFPNGLLLVLCLPIGILWAWVFSRSPNLYALALSHGLLGATIKEFIENIYWAGLSVGPRLM